MLGMIGYWSDEYLSGGGYLLRVAMAVRDALYVGSQVRPDDIRH